MNLAPIGIFDSGIGGTSIWREIVKLLPNENTLYLADSKNAPYGEKSKEEIIQLCVKNVDYLLAHGAKIIVVACNTATTNAIDFLRAKYNVPFVAIEPAIKPAALQSVTKAIGILATRATLASDLLQKNATVFAKDVLILKQEGTGLVPLIEQNKIDSPEMKALLIKYTQPMLAKNIDYLVLGCSHYPYLTAQLKAIVGDNVKIIDSGLAVAKRTKHLLEEHLITNQTNQPGTHQLISNLDATILKEFVKDIPNIHVSIQNF